ncbi:MAG: replicative DNA helicase [Firmicutes bacterium]|nr:replicative DNA helicase [Bacillota bacterium]MDD4263805.1 replicative DNA helicase [Bacillota bacterium]MDD4693560.1 replicative DNA helicase [Bacillota bacterium]
MIIKTDTKSSIPFDLASERRILGILIRYPDLLDKVITSLKETHFYLPENRLIYKRIIELYREDGKLSYTALAKKLLQNGDMDEPSQFLMGLADSFISRSELEPSILSVREEYAKRRIIEATDEIASLITSGKDTSLNEIQAKAQQLIFEATTIEADASNEVKDLLEVLERCYTNLVSRTEGTKPSGLRVGYPSIDSLTTGLKDKDLIILAGRPSMGKTALALNWSINIAKRGSSVLIFSLEMDDESIGDRFVISELFSYRKDDGSPLVTSFEYQTKLDDEKMKYTAEAFNDLYRLPIKIVDKRGLTVDEIKAKARQVKAEDPGLSLIIIDYLQLIKPRDNNRNSWALQVGEIVRELRDLAGELDLPLVLLSQLNRGVEMRENKRPLMSDLRDSGNIEEFADIVCFVYRDEYYYPDQAEERGTKGIAELIFAKQRKGETGTAYLSWHPEYARFIDKAL